MSCMRELNELFVFGKSTSAHKRLDLGLRCPNRPGENSPGGRAVRVSDSELTATDVYPKQRLFCLKIVEYGSLVS
jgi:hypothetical protein